MTCTLDLNDLDHFMGTEQYHRFPLFPSAVFTDGVYFLAKHATWLVSDILVHMRINPKVRGEEFVSVKFVAKDGKGTLTLDDGNDNILDTQEYSYVDFPDGEVKFYFTDGVLLLASEY